ncbi:class I SAM-dependent methyltransferase [bacterium SCSIO 12827]|nr:class I SAM-dependent methyltransferase [bacterium SCSIO 12827]
MTQIKYGRATSFVIGRIFVPILFPIARHVKDQLFLRRMNNPLLKPSPISRPLSYITRAWGYFGRVFRREFDDYALRRYSTYIRRHYSQSGRGYFSYSNLKEEEKAALFGQPEGRLQGFIDHYGDLLNYQDGDTIFDAGCGRGQNVKTLLEALPTSPIDAMDISAEAVSVITAAIKSPRVKTWAGDLTDPAVLGDLQDNAYDHVVISHVLSVILGNGIDATQNVRKEIIGNLARLARKTVLIIDSPAIIAAEERFEIEQRDRGWFASSILPICEDLPTQVVVLTSSGSIGVLMRKHSGDRD